ncbi:MAG: hypothetical protein Q8P95_00830 [bacterium]|nr:hypothetical protein [bacterium]
MSTGKQIPFSSSKLAKSIQEHAGTEIDKKTQETVNKPWSDSATSLSAEDKQFLEEVMKKIEVGEINLLQPGTIINQAVYAELEGKQQSQADLFINSALFLLRQIYDFYHSAHDNDSDMMIDMVKELRLKKEALEKEMGDVLKI